MSALRPFFEIYHGVTTAHTGPSPGLTHAAVRPVIPGIRCNCKIYGKRGFEVDSNTVERTILPIALQRKNALFAGHDAGARNWAMLVSLIETCKLTKIEQHTDKTGVFTAIINGHKQKHIDQLLPWNLEVEVALTEKVRDCDEKFAACRVETHVSDNQKILCAVDGYARLTRLKCTKMSALHT